MLCAARPPQVLPARCYDDEAARNAGNKIRRRLALRDFASAGQRRSF